MRRSAIYGAVGIVTLALGVPVAGCIFFTGGTSGYQLEPSDAGATSIVIDAASCGCAIGQTCCADPASASLLCQDAGACAFETVQLCSANSQCENASCVTQQCSVPPYVVTLSSCGIVPGCDAGATDSSAVYSAPVDSGTLPLDAGAGG